MMTVEELATERNGVLLLYNEDSEIYVLSRQEDGINLNTKPVCFIINTLACF